MLRRVLILFVLLLAVSSGLAQEADPAGQALQDAKRLTEQGDYEGALTKHLWFHDNALKVDPAYYGVRLSFALSDWIDLGKKYPKALEKLKSIRNEKTARLAGGEANRDLYHDVAAINENLNEVNATVDLFKRIDTSNPEFASEVYKITEEALVRAHEYALARKYLGDPKERLAADERILDEDVQGHPPGRPIFEKLFAANVVRIITILRETEAHAAAKEIQTEALTTLDSETIREALR
jgi:hypothetical protein